MEDPRKVDMAVIPQKIYGAQVQSKESFLYGRFETMMRPAYGSGIISSFFTFDDTPGFQNAWHEIDFEFLGRHTNQIDTNVIKTVNGKKTEDVGKIFLGARASDLFWKLSIQWEPGRIIWNINDQEVRRVVIGPEFNKKQKLMMNIWASNSENWAGKLMPSMLPQFSEYQYIRYSAYENGQFKFKWQDDFNLINEMRWQVATWNLDHTFFRKENAFLENGNLVLKLGF